MQKPLARNLNLRAGRRTKNGVQLETKVFLARVIFKSPVPVLFSLSNISSARKDMPLEKKTFGLFGVIG